MAWKNRRTTKDVDVEIDLDEFEPAELLQALINAKYLSNEEAERLLARGKAQERLDFDFSAGLDNAELDIAHDELVRGRKQEALVHLERALGWRGLAS